MHNALRSINKPSDWREVIRSRIEFRQCGYFCWAPLPTPRIEINFRQLLLVGDWLHINGSLYLYVRVDINFRKHRSCLWNHAEGTGKMRTPSNAFGGRILWCGAAFSRVWKQQLAYLDVVYIFLSVVFLIVQLRSLTLTVAVKKKWGCCFCLWGRHCCLVFFLHIFTYFHYLYLFLFSIVTYRFLLFFF